MITSKCDENRYYYESYNHCQVSSLLSFEPFTATENLKYFPEQFNSENSRNSLEGRQLLVVKGIIAWMCVQIHFLKMFDRCFCFVYK